MLHRRVLALIKKYLIVTPKGVSCRNTLALLKEYLIEGPCHSTSEWYPTSPILVLNIKDPNLSKATHLSGILLLLKEYLLVGP